MLLVSGASPAGAAKGGWDFNHDGVDDVILQNNGDLDALLGNISRFELPTSFSTGVGASTWQGVGDFNRDGIGDVVLKVGASMVVYLGNGTGFTNAGTWRTGINDFDWRGIGNFASGQSKMHTYPLWDQTYGLHTYQVALGALTYDCENGHSRTYFNMWWDATSLPTIIDAVSPVFQWQALRFNVQLKPYSDSQGAVSQDIDPGSKFICCRTLASLPEVEMFPPAGGGVAGRMKEIRMPIGVDDGGGLAWPRVIKVPMTYATHLTQPTN